MTFETPGSILVANPVSIIEIQLEWTTAAPDDRDTAPDLHDLPISQLAHVEQP